MKEKIVIQKDNCHKYNKKVTKSIFWQSVHIIEICLIRIYNTVLPFIPALVFDMLPNRNNLITLILLCAGILKIVYKIMNCTSINKIYLKLKGVFYFKE